MHTHTTPTRRGALTTALLLAALIMLTAALPAAASAQLRSITRTFAPATERPSLEPRAPLTQREELPQSITVSYDQAAGVLAAHVAIYDAALWNSRLPHMDINLGSDCENLDQVKAWAEYERYGDSDDEIENAAVLSISGYAGQLHGTITPTPDGFDLSIPHPALAGRDLRCVEINGNLIAGPRVPEGPVLAYFDGYQPVEPVQLTKRNATGLFKQQLAGRYGSAFTGASQFWVKCPSQESLPTASTTTVTRARCARRSSSRTAVGAWCPPASTRPTTARLWPSPSRVPGRAAGPVRAPSAHAPPA